jgi:hypothetical protein
MAKKQVRSLPVGFRSRPGPGRPPVHAETWSKVSVVLFDRQILHLDRLASDTRAGAGRTLNRAEVIRALIDGLIDSGMDITSSPSEADLRARVARRLGTPFR